MGEAHGAVCRGRAPVYAAKALDADAVTDAPGCWGGVLNPPRPPHGECGVWGRAPRIAEGYFQGLPLEHAVCMFRFLDLEMEVGEHE